MSTQETILRENGHELKKKADGSLDIYYGDKHTEVFCTRCNDSWCLDCIDLHPDWITKCNPQPEIATICRNCKWYVKHTRLDSLVYDGVCHWLPPVLYMGADGLRKSRHSDVMEIDFCGQFKVSASVKTGE